MKIKLDRTVCDGFGKCAEHAPSVFSLDEWGYASLAGPADVPGELEPRVRRAILDCPVDAIIERLAPPAASSVPTINDPVAAAEDPVLAAEGPAPVAEPLAPPT
jgi:ferredoxin